MSFDPKFFASLKENAAYVERLCDRVWLMDDHRWAYWVWEMHRAQTGSQDRYDLLHFDYHFDAINDFHDNPAMVEALKAADIQEVTEWVANSEDPYIRYDSFIAPAIIRGLLNDVHFFCRQTDTDPGIYGDFPGEYGCRQLFYDSINAASEAEVRRPFIFDLCLDLFNLDQTTWYQGELWPLEQVHEALDAWRTLIAGDDILTISLSFGYSGTADHTRTLAEMVIPRIIQIRTAASD